MNRLCLSLVVAFLFSLCTTALSQTLNNNIITFGSKQARQTYIDLLKQQEPDVETILLDNVFIGLITRHTRVETFSRETARLDRMFVAGQMSILGFERDQVMTVSQIAQPSPPWHLDRVNQRALPLDRSFEFDPSEDTINIYIADTGVRVTHNEFEGRAAAGYSAVSGSPAGEDCHGHGTHVAALTAGRTYGVAKNANIWDVRVLDCRGSGSTSGILQGMDWIAKNARKPAVVNMSLGGGYSSSLNNAISSLFRAGVLPIVAAGNENTDACTKSPASAPDALTVGATESSDSRSSFSNYGQCVDVYSPGTSIKSAGITSDSSTATMSGTSMASPIAAGIAAYILSKNPSFTPAQLTAKVLEVATTTVNSNIRPFVFYEPQSSSPDPGCPTGYTGSNCDVPICFNVPATSGSVCSGRGSCIAPDSCSCNSGFTGNQCEAEVQEPEEPKQPGQGKVVAFIIGDAVRRTNAAHELVLDASLSHSTAALQREMCENDKQASEFRFTWSCTSDITNSEQNPFCQGATFSKTGRLTLSSEKLENLRGSGPVVFNVNVELASYVSDAKVIVVVEDN